MRKSIELEIMENMTEWCPAEAVRKLEADFNLCIENYRQLLCEAKNLYESESSYKRKTADEYFSEETEYLSSLEEDKSK